MRLAIAGGGLAGGLLAARLLELRPDLSFTVLEAGPRLGGNHTWSFHETDVSPAWLDVLRGLGARRFDGGHDVRLPGLERTLGGAYWSLRSEDFHRVLGARLGERLRLRSCVGEVGSVDADCVIDARGAMPSWPCGWQKFLGQDLELQAPHGLERPLLMDATVEQLDGFRFVYALPWGPCSVLVEDTIYSDGPALDAGAARVRIAQWVEARGWRLARVVREEQAALPIPLRGDAPVLDRPVIGVAAGFFHATTGYSLPFAARIADAICALPSLDAATVTAFLAREARRHWRSQAFFRLLNRMLFEAAGPADRARVFASFYRHDEALISRFYAGELGARDVLSVLRRGAGTAPVWRAVSAAARAA